MSHLRSAQENVQAHRVAGSKKSRCAAGKEVEGLNKTAKLEQFFTALHGYSSACWFACRWCEMAEIKVFGRYRGVTPSLKSVTNV